MNDRELLELAAKASGFGFMEAQIRGGFEYGFCKSGVFTGLRLADQKIWNPLTDDGDALRLAVKLAIEISPCPEHDSVLCEPKGSPDSIITTEALEDYGTRRAIVRAAAEIGRTK
ncbi:hypothetical protein [Stutzerimonas nitrititolerans]|uniref:hypothetical protein n=1 Tax=Stutzerimonas nitrititolerans TaxID=2482751 RepID=UPI0028B0F21D|nr:hypothetical protein [Stutzerimonas nitrititolerans]